MVRKKFLHIRKLFTTALTFAVVLVSQAQDLKGDPVKGEQLFTANCTACHALDKKVVCAPLKGVTDKYKRDWLQHWIKDNVAFRASGDPVANKIFKENGGSLMQVFPKLSEQDIDDILAYTKNPPAPKVEVKEATSTTAGATGTGSVASNSMLIVGFGVISALLLWILSKISTLVKLTQASELTPDLEDKVLSFDQIFNKYKPLAFLGIGLFIFGSIFGLWSFLINIGVDKGYQPEQPIYFSHKIHAGEQGINCQYCHSSAKYSKVSGIPSGNVCMNCHKQISEYKGSYVEEGKSKEFYTAEIQKLYNEVGWDKDAQKYTGEIKPIKWTRIHNMPDFVYYNHSTHISVGEKVIIESYNKKHPEKPIDVVCKACHGAVDTMNVVKMANDFTMGWCIDCHRTTNVDMKNEYNKVYYAKLHDKLKAQYGDNTSVTVDAIGGMECAKCHY